MIEKPSDGRARIFKRGRSIEIQIPARKRWFLIIFLTAWLGGWTMGETFAIGQVFSGDFPNGVSLLLLLWLTGWTAGGFFAITTLLWSIAGMEVIIVEDGVLGIGRRIFIFKRSKQYDVKAIKHLQVSPIPNNDIWGLGYQRDVFGTKTGTVKFDYGLKTVRFASGLDDAEARLLIESFKQSDHFKEANFG